VIALTALIWYRTRRYAKDTQKPANQAKAANKIERRNPDWSVDTQLPYLVVTLQMESDDHRSADVDVANLGSSAVVELSMDTSWGSLQGGGLKDGETWKVAQPNDHANPEPFEVKAFHFRDVIGDEWRQLPGDPPQRVTP
jgi:hypothetical protein